MNIGGARNPRSTDYQSFHGKKFRREADSEHPINQLRETKGEVKTFNVWTGRVACRSFAILQPTIQVVWMQGSSSGDGRGEHSRTLHNAELL